MKKIILLLSCIIALQVGYAQSQDCVTIPRWGSVSNPTRFSYDGTADFTVNTLKPSCDSFFALVYTLHSLRSGNNTTYLFDSIKQTTSEQIVTEHIAISVETHFSERFWWQCQMRSEKKDSMGNYYTSYAFYGPYLYMRASTYTGPCMPPSHFCIYTPGATDVTFVWDSTPGNWDAPEEYEIEYQEYPKDYPRQPHFIRRPIAYSYQLENLKPGTTYTTKIRFRTATSTSYWVPGPYFTTAPDTSGLKQYAAKNEAQIRAANNNTVFVFPNPVQDYLHLTIPAALLHTQLKIYSLSGALVQTCLLQSQSMQIDLHHLTAGMYFLHFANGAVQKIAVIQAQ